MASPPIPENVEDLVNPPDIAVAPPTELVCPTIPGVKFPELPDVEAFGALIGEKLDSAADAVSETFEDLEKKAKALEERIKNPPSATDMMNEMSTQVSSAAEKAAKALEKAAIDAAAQVEENLAAEWDKQVEFAKQSGAALANIYAGFKNATECLKGAAGGAEESFNKTAPELDAGVDEGRGQDGATAALAITEKSEVVATEDGEKVSKQEVLTEEKRDAILTTQKELTPEKPITANPVPVSVNALPTYRDEKEYSQYMALVGHTVSGNEFVTNSGRTLTAAEQTRYDAGLPPLFVSGIIRIFKFRRIPPGKITIAMAQTEYDSSLSKRSTTKQAAYSAERRRQGLVEMQEIWAATDGRTIPSEAYVPYNDDDGPPPHYGWRKFSAWHPLSYNVQAGPPPEFDPTVTEPFLGQGVPIYDSLGWLYEKTEEYNLEEGATWDQRWTYSRIGGSFSVRAPTSFRKFA